MVKLTVGELVQSQLVINLISFYLSLSTFVRYGQSISALAFLAPKLFSLILWNLPMVKLQ